MVTRRASLVSMAALAGTALPHVARADTVALRVGLVPIWDVGPFYAADQQGYFAAENLSVTPQVVRGGSAAISALSGESLDIVYSNGVSIVQAIASGIDLRLIMQGAPMPAAPPDPGALLKRKGEPLRTGKDLEGKTVGVNALRDVTWMFLTQWLRTTGADVSKVQIVEVPLPGMVEALKARRVDAVLTLDPFLTLGLADPNVELLSWILSRVYPNGPVAFYAVTPKTAASRPNDVRAFVRAYKRGVTWMNANAGKDTFYTFIAGFTGMNVELIRKMRSWPAHAEIEVSTLPLMTSLMTQTGLLTSNVDLRTKVFT